MQAEDGMFISARDLSVETIKARFRGVAGDGGKVFITVDNIDAHLQIFQFKIGGSSAAAKVAGALMSPSLIEAVVTGSR
jgi:hypothetical protein